MKSILLIDGQEAQRVSEKNILEGSYMVTAIPPEELTEAFSGNTVPDLILLSVTDTQTDGFAALERIKTDPKTAQVPIICLTAGCDADAESGCLKAGAADFVSRPFAAETLCARIERTLELEKLRKSSAYAAKSSEQVEQLSVSIVKALAHTIDAKDRYTSGHSQRVATYSMEIARRMGKTPEEQEIVYYMGLLHDVGKIRVPAEIINKPGKLTDEEFDLIKLHPITGYHILKEISAESSFSDGARFHHERYDGSGYPNGLAGKQIPEIARIIGVADAYDAMTSNRSYRQVLMQEYVREEMELGKGTQFDPEIADIMLEIIDGDKEYKLRETGISKKRLLIVDDEPINIKLATFALKNISLYSFAEAKSGADALDILKKERFDLVLLDVNMPEMNGFETAEGIRAFSGIPIVLMTADKSMIEMEKLRKYGISDFITRPFKPAILLEILHAVLAE